MKKKPVRPLAFSHPAHYVLLVLTLLFVLVITKVARADRDLNGKSLSFAVNDSKKKQGRHSDPPTLTEDSAEQPAQSSAAESLTNGEATSATHSDFKLSATIDLTSNYLYRGISQTHGRPAVQASLDLNHDSGFGLGIFTSNIDLDDSAGAASGSEADGYLVYNRTLQSWKFGAMFISSNYVNAPEFSSVEYSAYLGWNFLKIDLGYAPKYFQNPSSSLYTRLSATLHLNSNDTLILAGGRTTFANEKNIGFKSYSDARLGVSHSADNFAVEIDFTATDRRRTTNEAFADQAISATIARTFE